MTGGKKTPYGRTRRLAYDLWRGPEYITKPDENEPFGGPCILRLALRTGTSAKPQIEARAVYGSFTEQDAILRAVYWDGQTAVKNSEREEQQIKIPASFVRVPVASMRQWISIFDNLQTSLQTMPQQNDSLPICSLRVEIDAVYSVFEKVWQVAPGEADELQHAWQDVWQQLGLALETFPAITDVEEIFPYVEGKPEVYDVQAYKPSLQLS